MIDFDKITKKIDKFAQEHEKKTRYEHSVRVAKMCELLCKKFNLDQKAGYLIGITHDICKDFSAEELLSLAKKDGKSIYEMELKMPALLHGRAAAILLKEQFGVEDEQLIEAVANHVSACPGMCDYTKILYIADKIEPGRKHITDEYRNELLNLSLDEMVYKVIYENYLYVKGKGFNIYPTTEIMISELKTKLGLE